MRGLLWRGRTGLGVMGLLVALGLAAALPIKDEVRPKILKENAIRALGLRS